MPLLGSLLLSHRPCRLRLRLRLRLRRLRQCLRQCQCRLRSAWSALPRNPLLPRSRRLPVPRVCFPPFLACHDLDSCLLSFIANERTCEAIYDYQATTDQEISLAENQTVTVIQRDTAGWWLVRRDDTGEEGWAPEAYLRPKRRSIPARPPPVPAPVPVPAPAPLLPQVSAA